MQSLRGKVAAVTGGGSGIGRALALAFAEEGMDVAIADIERDPAETVAEEVRAKGQRAFAMACDVSDRSSVGRFADFVYNNLEAAHVVCNNAGVVAGKPTPQMTHDDWDWVMGVDLYGVIYGIQAFLPRMLSQGDEGHFVNTSSITGLVPWSAPGIISYTAAKHGVVGLSEGLNLELAADKIGVTVLVPGQIRTRIGESARNRPTRTVVDPQPPATSPSSPTAAGGAQRLPVGAEMTLEPEDLASRVVGAVRAGDLYVFTHPATLDEINLRFEAIMQGYDWVDRALAREDSPEEA